jgi:hypothetical protein
MNESGQPVGGGIVITADGQTETIYFSYISSGPSTGLFYRINDGSPNGVSLPITIENENTPYRLKVLFETDIILNSDIAFFIVGSDNIQFGSTSLNPDGSRPTITIDNVINYPGLIQNGTIGTPAKAGIYIVNLIVDGTNSTLVEGGGWFGQEGYANRVASNWIINCSSFGPINTEGGGIVGRYAGYGDSAVATPPNLSIIGCTSSGSIGFGAGGIAGRYAADNSGKVTISQCSSSGTIADEAGGIVGANPGQFITISGCYSTGAMVGTGAGGIVGIGTLLITITNCYSTGNIGTNCGGIVGQSSSSVTVTNCYSIGLIGTNAGGIFGWIASGPIPSHCYTSGGHATASNGIVPGSTDDNDYGTNNYSEANNGNSGDWSTAHASVLTGKPTDSSVGSSWASIGINIPYLLALYGITPYNLITVNLDASVNPLIDYFSATIAAGTSTNPAISPAGYTYALLGAPSGITISANGAITASSAVSATTYTLYVYASINPYSITTYTLTVEEAAALEAASAVCCGSLAGQSNLDYATITDIQAGNAFAADRSNPRFRFASYADYVKYQMSRAFTH